MHNLLIPKNCFNLQAHLPLKEYNNYFLYKFNKFTYGQDWNTEIVKLLGNIKNSCAIASHAGMQKESAYMHKLINTSVCFKYAVFIYASCIHYRIKLKMFAEEKSK